MEGDHQPSMFEERIDVHKPPQSQPPLIQDKDLVSLPVRELNKRFKVAHTAKVFVREYKKRRRTIKNRGYAANCRNKRNEERTLLEQTEQDMLNETRGVEEQISSIEIKINMMRAEIGRLTLLEPAMDSYNFEELFVRNHDV